MHGLCCTAHKANFDESRKDIYNKSKRWGWLVAGAARGLQNRWGVLLRRPWWVRLPSIPADRENRLRWRSAQPEPCAVRAILSQIVYVEIVWSRRRTNCGAMDWCHDTLAQLPGRCRSGGVGASAGAGSMPRERSLPATQDGRGLGAKCCRSFLCRSAWRRPLLESRSLPQGR